MQNYKKSILVAEKPEISFAALTHGIEHWWTKPDKPIRNVGDQAKFTFPPGQSFWTFEAIDIIPYSYVKLQCVDALHIHEGQPKEIEQEWLGTWIEWKISPHKAGSKIDMEHHGLVPELLCFKVCNAGWDMFFIQSLKSYLDTGVGRPHTAK